MAPLHDALRCYCTTKGNCVQVYTSVCFLFVYTSVCLCSYLERRGDTQHNENTTEYTPTNTSKYSEGDTSTQSQYFLVKTVRLLPKQRTTFVCDVAFDVCRMTSCVVVVGRCSVPVMPVAVAVNMLPTVNTHSRSVAISHGQSYADFACVYS